MEEYGMHNTMDADKKKQNNHNEWVAMEGTVVDVSARHS